VPLDNHDTAREINVGFWCKEASFSCTPGAGWI
jgi:hypothetical protein